MDASARRHARDAPLDMLRGVGPPGRHAGVAESWRNTPWGKHLIAWADGECVLDRSSEGCPWKRHERPERRRLIELHGRSSNTSGWRGYSSMADNRKCGQISINRHNVTKCTNCHCRERVPTASGLPADAAYFLEKLALCRLRRCARPCAGRDLYFPLLLTWNDLRLTLVSRFEGRPLATDVVARKLLFDLDDVERAAGAFRHAPVRTQVECMRRQLLDAGVVHMDVGCKNIFMSGDAVPTGSLTLGDFDAVLVDGFFVNLVHPWGAPPRSDAGRTWDWLNTSPCFRRGHAGGKPFASTRPPRPEQPLPQDRERRDSQKG